MNEYFYNVEGDYINYENFDNTNIEKNDRESLLMNFQDNILNNTIATEQLYNTIDLNINDFITFSNTKQEEMINIMLKFPPITNILILKKLPINKAESITRELKQKNYRFIQILEHSVINRFLNMIDNK
jgi:hypothetical protein